MPKGDKLAERNKAKALEKHSAQEHRYIVDTASGCWIWSGGRSPDGYGKLKRGGKTLRAHRFFYERFVADIPQGLVVCHRCDTPLCVNPEHLFVGTQLDNERDKDRKQRRSPSPSLSHPHLLRRGEQHHKAKITAEAVRVIRSSGLPTRTLADTYRLSMSTIQRIRGRKLWAHIL